MAKKRRKRKKKQTKKTFKKKQFTKNEKREHKNKSTSVKKCEKSCIKIPNIKVQSAKYIRLNLIIIFHMFMSIICSIFIIKTSIYYPNIIFYNLKSYDIGELLVMDDGSEWYVIFVSDKQDRTVTLISKDPIDINGDAKIDKNDKISFDSQGNYNYDETKNDNIGYFLQTKVKDLLNKIEGLKKIRLLTSEEYINIRTKMNFGYDWNENNWLANKNLEEWWLETSNYKMIYTVTERGSYRLYSPTEKKLVRPVIEIDKIKLK